MAKYKKEEIIKAKVIGLQNYGAFVEVDDEYQGLIHISEISYGYVKNINDYVKIGDKIYTEVIKVDENNNQLQLSIKDIDYKNDGKRCILALYGWFNRYGTKGENFCCFVRKYYIRRKGKKIRKAGNGCRRKR